jgi:hypothetical protein
MDRFTSTAQPVCSEIEATQNGLTGNRIYGQPFLGPRDLRSRYGLLPMFLVFSFQYHGSERAVNLQPGVNDHVGVIRHCNDIVMVARSERIVSKQNGS